MQIIDSVYFDCNGNSDETRAFATKFTDMFMKIIEAHEKDAFADAPEHHARAFIENSNGESEWFSLVDPTKDYRNKFRDKLINWFITMVGVAYDYEVLHEHAVTGLMRNVMMKIGDNGDYHFRFYYGSIDSTFDPDIDSYDGLDIVFNEND